MLLSYKEIVYKVVLSITLLASVVFLGYMFRCESYVGHLTLENNRTKGGPSLCLLMEFVI